MDNRHRNTVAELCALSVLLIAAALLYLGDVDKSIIVGIYAGSLVLAFCLIFTAFINLILAARLFLIFIVGAYPLGIKLMGENLYFSVYEFSTQTLTVATTMYSLSLIGLVGAYLGWGAGRAGAPRQIDRGAVQFAVPRDYYFWVYCFCACFALLSGFLITIGSTGTILNASYGTGTEGSPVIGSAAALGGTALSVMFYCTLIQQKRRYWIVFVVVALYVLFWSQILRGLRQDAVGAVFSCLMLYLMFRLKDTAIKLRYIVYVFPAYLLLELWGLVRTGLSAFLRGEISFSEVLDMGLGNAATMPGVVYSGTLGPIATTFANVVALFERNAISVIYGSGYFDYLLRTPPEFMYPERPKDYASMFPDYGLSSGGGFFELAEAYLNFGLIGTFIVPFTVSYLISRTYHRALGTTNIFYIFALSSILSVWMRGSWYQTFAFYKSFITALAMYFVVHALASAFVQRRRM